MQSLRKGYIGNASPKHVGLHDICLPCAFLRPFRSATFLAYGPATDRLPRTYLSATFQLPFSYLRRLGRRPWRKALSSFLLVRVPYLVAVVCALNKVIWLEIGLVTATFALLITLFTGYLAWNRVINRGDFIPLYIGLFQ